jgi:hypothetical protein
VSDAELRRLLAADDYFLDGESLIQWERVLARGELAAGGVPHGQLFGILRDTENPIVVDRIFRMFAEAIVDGHEHSGRRRAAKAFLARVSADESLAAKTRRRMLCSAADALGRFGEAEDAEALLPLLDGDDWIVRANAARALAKIGDEATANKIAAILEERAQKHSAEELRADLSFREGFKAIAEIKYRALLKQHGGE